MSNVAELIFNPKTRTNPLINGNFFYDQRFLSTFTYSGPISAYVLDRWLFGLDESVPAASTIKNIPFVPGQTEVPGEPEVYLQWKHNSSSADGTSISMEQRIESVRTLAGGRVGISFSARADSAITGQIQFTQSFGTGGSADLSTLVQNINLTTGWTLYEFVFDLPSINGKIIGLNSFLKLMIRLPVNTTFTFDLANVMVTAGGPAPFSLAGKNFIEELHLCQRYYEKSYAVSDIPGTVAAAYWTVREGTHVVNQPIRLATIFKVEKRTAPTMIYYNPFTGAANLIRINGVARTVTASNVTTTGHSLENNNHAAAAGSISVEIHWTADAEL